MLTIREIHRRRVALTLEIDPAQRKLARLQDELAEVLRLDAERRRRVLAEAREAIAERS